MIILNIIRATTEKSINSCSYSYIHMESIFRQMERMNWYILVGCRPSDKY